MIFGSKKSNQTDSGRIRLTDPFFIAALFFLGALNWVALIFKVPDLTQERLARTTVLSLNAALFCVLLGSAWAFDSIRQAFGIASKNSRRLLMGLIAISVLLTATIVPKTNRIFYDEQIYQGIGQHIARTSAAYLCLDCDLDSKGYRPQAVEYNKQPNGFPFYLSLFYRFFGVHESLGHIANWIALVLGGLGVFGSALLLAGRPLAAVLAVTIYLDAPMMLRWSNTVASEPSTAAFGALALFSALLFQRFPGFPTGILSAGTLAWAAQFRPESCLVVPPILLCFALDKSNRNIPWKHYLLWGAFTLFLSAPMIAHLLYFHGHDWGSGGDKFTTAVFLGNLRANGLFYLDPRRFPIAFTLLFFLGVGCWRRWRGLLPLFTWFFSVFVVFLFFYAGSYEYGADVRYSLLILAPLALLGGIGGVEAVSGMGRWIGHRKALVVIGLFLFFSWLPLAPGLRVIGEEGSDARIDVVIAEELAKTLPPHSFVMTHIPAMWHAWGRSAGDFSRIGPQADDLFLRDHLKRFPGGVYFHWNYWCNVVPPERRRACEQVLASHHHELFQERRAMDKRFALYRFLP